MLAELRPYLRFWRTVVTVVAPLLLCPLVFVINTSEAKENVNPVLYSYHYLKNRKRTISTKLDNLDKPHEIII